MKSSDRKLVKDLGVERKITYDKKELQKTIEKAKSAFAESEAESVMSRGEFLFLQSRYIHRRCWVMQGMVLFLLGLLLQVTEGGFYISRCMGIGASLFAVFLLPELWKNRNSNAMEIECTSYFSLRQIYAARIFFLAAVDCLLLFLFGLPVVWTGKMEFFDILIQFFLPYLVTSCICFRVLCSNRTGSELLTVILCFVWCAIWTQIVLNEKVYEMISEPVWIIMVLIAGFYLGYCIYRTFSGCMKLWEVNVL